MEKIPSRDYLFAILFIAGIALAIGGVMGDANLLFIAGMTAAAISVVGLVLSFYLSWPAQYNLDRQRTSVAGGQVFQQPTRPEAPNPALHLGAPRREDAWPHSTRQRAVDVVGTERT